MKKLHSIPVVLMAILPAVAQAPQEVKIWKAAELKAFATKLGPQVKAGLATENLAVLNGRNLLVVHRQADGEAEFHEGAGDFTVVESGSGTLVVGGTVKDGKTTAPGEIRGPSIEGGKSHSVAAGDIFNIPAKTPHQVLVPKGGQITYLVLKTPGN